MYAEQSHFIAVWCDDSEEKTKITNIFHICFYAVRN